jgi:regulatory protein YycI of two-component signal transduction system YycFG
MEWRKLKTIILLILLAMNLTLVPLVLGPQFTEEYHRARADREAELFLEQRGIDLQGADIPDTAQLPPMLVERDREGEAAAARALGSTPRIVAYKIRKYNINRKTEK